MREAKTVASDGGGLSVLQSGQAVVSSLGSSEAVTAAAGARGLGYEVSASGQLQEDDDEFDQYRKRMMLAYRFRPNPLVRFYLLILESCVNNMKAVSN